MATLVLLSISDLMEEMNLVPEEAPNPGSFQLEPPITRKRRATEKNAINNFRPAYQCL